MVMKSITKATGWPWKLAPWKTSCPSKNSGLSLAELSSMSSLVDVCQCVADAPSTCGMARNE